MLTTISGGPAARRASQVDTEVIEPPILRAVATVGNAIGSSGSPVRRLRERVIAKVRSDVHPWQESANGRQRWRLSATICKWLGGRDSKPAAGVLLTADGATLVAATGSDSGV